MNTDGSKDMLQRLKEGYQALDAGKRAVLAGILLLGVLSGALFLGKYAGGHAEAGGAAQAAGAEQDSSSDEEKSDTSVWARAVRPSAGAGSTSVSDKVKKIGKKAAKAREAELEKAAGEAEDGKGVEKENAASKSAEAAETTSGSEKSEEATAQETSGQDGVSAEMEEILAVEASIQPGQYPIMGASSITQQQMADYFYASGKPYPSGILGAGGAADIETFCQIYYEEAVSEGVRPEVAFAQTMKETGWLQYGGDAQITQYNFAGLGTTGGGVQGNSFPDVRTGVRAQIQHLKAYATDAALENDCVDSRYEYVTKGCAPYVEWLGQQENPDGYGWATGVNYGYDIVEMIFAMRAY